MSVDGHYMFSYSPSHSLYVLQRIPPGRREDPLCDEKAQFVRR